MTVTSVPGSTVSVLPSMVQLPVGVQAIVTSTGAPLDRTGCVIVMAPTCRLGGVHPSATLVVLRSGVLDGALVGGTSTRGSSVGGASRGF